MIERQSDSGFIIESDTLPIINENQTEVEEEEHIGGFEFDHIMVEA